MELPFYHIGELAALGAAFLWAVATVLFRRIGFEIPPLLLNLLKGLVSLLLVGPTLLLTQESHTPVEPAGWLLLLLSGVFGIGCGDTFFFASLNRIGEGRSVLIVETVAPLFATLFSMGFLYEFLPLQGFLGIAVTVAGVGWVLAERTTPSDGARRRAKRGILLGLAAAFFQAVGSVLSRAAFLHTEITPMWSTLIRLIGGNLFLLVFISLRGQALFPRALMSLKIWTFILAATFFGTYLGILFQQISLKYTSAGIAQTLMGTSALFVLPFTLLRGERVSLRAVLGALVALCGIFLLFSLK
ncbi:MAG: DMT family transporter [Deltaproteobacteria bacterium]|nr:DMT family transporter [Deltaproteobacteria bacterium]